MLHQCYYACGRSDRRVGIPGIMQRKVTRLDPKDNVLVALSSLRAGETVTDSDKEIQLASEIPAKHKFATARLSAGSEIVMYGVLVGKATREIAEGELLTTGNVKHEAAPYREKAIAYHWTAPDVSRWRERTFRGFRRTDGRVGTRNFWVVLPLVFCENRNLSVLKQAFEEELGFGKPQAYRHFVRELARLYREGHTEEISKIGFENAPRDSGASVLFPNVDGIKFLAHEGGCGGTREDARNLCGLLAGYIHHPNVAGATVLSLGCQNAQVSILREELRLRNAEHEKPILIFEQQKSRSEAGMISDCIRGTFLGLIEADKSERTAAPLSSLNIGLKCGGSDGFSGISANPALGHVADLMAALGGSAILSEFPELCGVEQGLMDRCVNKEVAERFARLMTSYAARAKAVGSGFDMNPSPGNIRDGLITDAMKSAGAAKKGGRSPVTAVLDYPEYLSTAGLNLQCTPGNDVECVTAQVGAGANVVLFTTGLGTPTGNPIVPVVKISTNSELAKRMSDIIDLDCGGIVRGEATVEEMGDRLLDFVIHVASGEERTHAERLGQDDFIPWKRGVSL
jgi:altronate hydrolase